MPQHQPQPATVLLVEDVADTREMYADYLRHCGFEVTTASNAAEALDSTRIRIPDVILMDVAMPGLDGWAATRLLKNDPRTRNVPVLVLTAHVFAEHRERAREAGADGFIGKPCMPDELAREISAVLHRSRDMQPARERLDQPEPAKSVRPKLGASGRRRK